MIGRRGVIPGIHAVVLADDARVKNHDDTAVGGRSNQASKPLSQFDNRFRNLIVAKGIATSRFDRFQLGLQKRMIGDAERQLGNDYVAKRIAAHRHLAKTVGAKEC